MVSYAYDTVARNNPVALFGMVYALEKTSSTIATYAAGQIASTLELTPGAMSYMVSHGSLDVEHMQDFERLMKTLSACQMVARSLPGAQPGWVSPPGIIGWQRDF